jgi:hypothetical protein
MNSDSFFAIGRTHQICQDYCITGVKDTLPYAIVSDGCSASKDTDFGSRFLAKSAEHYVYSSQVGDPKFIDLHASIIRSEGIRKSIEMESECLDATLLVAKIEKNNIVVQVSGDGVIAARKKDGTLVIKTIDYKDNAPLYLNYILDPVRRDLLINAYDITKTITSYYCIGDTIDKATMIDPEVITEFLFPIEDYSYVAVMSDGVQSFHQIQQTYTSKTSVPVDVCAIVKGLMDFKGSAGSFVKRRCQKFLKECGENDVYHDDDVSIGVISL